LPAGYSGTPLAKKLGFKPGFRVKVVGAPANYRMMLKPIPDGVTLSASLAAPLDLCHVFVRSREALARRLPACRKQIRENGMIWVSWPKKSSGVSSDLSEDVVRELAFPLQLVDIKVCAVDETWSGLKLVIRREHRSPAR